MADSRKYSTDLDLQGNSIINGGFEQVVALPLLGYDGQIVSFRGKLYTWYNGKWNCVADDLGGREETREEQFTYQATANDESVKDGLAVVKSIKGNTVVANQLFDQDNWRCGNGASLSQEGDYLVITVGDTQVNRDLREPVFIKQNDKFLITAIVVPSFNIRLEIIVLDSNNNNAFLRQIFSIEANRENKLSFIGVVDSGDVGYVRFSIVNTTVGGEVLKFKELQCVDLTQMFGAGNEPAFEDFERLYPNLPTSYNEGSLLNLNADSIKSVGFNQFDEKMTPGYYSSETGLPIEDNTSLRNVNPVKVFPNTKYALSNISPSLYLYYYNNNMKYIGYVFLPVVKEFQTPEDCSYVNFRTQTAYGQIYKNDICINLSHSGYRNGEYEPYKESIVNLPIKDYFPDGMKSAGAIKDEIVWDEGLKKYKAIQRVGSLLLSDLTFRTNANNGFAWGFFAQIPNSYNIYVRNDIGLKENAVTPLSPINTADKVINYNNDGFCLYRDSGTAYFILKNSKYNYATDLELFKQFLQGQILYYKLATPIETIIDDYDLIDYEVSDFGTEEIIADESTTPIVADIQYGFNAVDEIRNHRFEIRDLKKLLSRGLNLNGVNVKLGDTSIIPAYITYNDALYPMRIQDNWLQIYRNGVWGDLFNLASEVIPSSYIEEFEGDWYNPNILEYILSDELTTQLISGKLDFRSIFSSITGFAGVKLSLQTFSPKEYDKSLDNILNAVTGYIVYVENDIDTMFNSGNNVLVKLNFDGMNRVTIECYTQR